MPVGRKPKPSALRELAGNVGHRPINKNEPKPTGVPTCPAMLNAVAKAEWQRVRKELVPMGLLTNVDRAALMAYCVVYARWVKAEDQIENLGEYIKSSKSGYLIQAPWVGVANKALELMHKYATEFGFTPSSRSRLSVERTKQIGKDDEFAISRPRNFVRQANYERRDSGVQAGEASVQSLLERFN
jgi:P27 family predicted phage terminase small subunit